MHHRVARGRHATRLAAALLSTTGLTSSLGAAAAAILIAGWALPARADGGNGGGGGTGGADSSNGTGGVGGGGGVAGGGGGGGAGQIGGQGGLGGGGGGGGLGGLAPGNPSANGQAGGPGVGLGGGGGGGGGAHGQIVVAPGTLVSATGGTGGGGGSNAGGGGGGAGGWGTSVIAAGSFTNAGTVAGGNGGNGGNSPGGDVGSGGSGGLGLFFSGGITSLVNSGTIAGGQGGLAGAGVLAGTPGAGGTGIVGGTGGFTIVNSGTISGGLSGDGVTRANAIAFSGGGTNSLTLQAGSTITGNVVAVFGGSDVLALGGSAHATFDVSQIGPTAQYENFANFQKTGSSTWTLTGTTASTTNWAINGGTLAISADNNLGGPGPASFNGGTLQFNASFTSSRTFALNAGGGTFDTNGNAVTLSGTIGGAGGLTKIGAGTLTLAGTGDYLGGTNINGGTLALTVASALGGGTLSFNGGTLQINSSMALSLPTTLNAGGGTINTNGFSLGLGQTISGPGGLTKTGAGTLTFGAPMTYTGGTTVNAGTLVLISGSSLSQTGTLTVNGGTFDMSAFAANLTVGALSGTGGTIALGPNTLITNSAGVNSTLASQITGTGGLLKQGAGTLTLASASTYSGGTLVGGGVINFSAADNFGTGMVTLNSSGLQWAAGTTTDISSQLAPLGKGGGSFDTNGNNVTFATPISGTGGLTKAGNGILTFTANNSYSGGTMVTGGLINFTSAGNFGSGMVILNGGGLQWASGTTADISSQLAPFGVAGGTFDTNGNNITFATGLTGTGGLTKQGLGKLNLTGNSTYSGSTAVMAGTLAVNGSIAGNVAVGAAGTLGGNGTIFGNVANAGTLAPGNSIGLLTVNGSYTQMAGSTYQVEVNNAGQGDRINVGGAAVIQGGTVQVLAAAGSYANSTTYTILNATGGVSGTYAGVTSNFAFLTPSLSYTANNVFLTLALGQNAFSAGGVTPNQKAVGVALNQSFANASGDFATVIGALAGLTTQQGPAALDAISGQPYADFGTMNTNNAAMFMNALGQQMAGFHGGLPAGQHLALAQACEIEACDGTSPLSAWASALGGLGSVLGDGNASTLTYNFGGGAAGIDYRLDPRFLVGIGTGYTHGTQWVNSFMGQGWSDSVSVAAYGSFTQAGFYLDALAGYAYYNNQLQRQIVIPGLQPRTATGSTGANQFLGQAETGYKLGVYAPAAATVTPFGRLQISSVTQNAFSESGAQSLSLNVAQQTTNSLRTTIGADLGSSIGFGGDKKVDFAVRLGWLHEFADVARPITAAFAGAPGNSFTVFGATPLRNSAVVGLQATTIAAATQIYLRYDGEIASGTDNHALNLGVRFSW
jgi:autotransporter-associated beta strand protein